MEEIMYKYAFITAVLLVALFAARCVGAQLTPIPPIPSSPNCQMIWVIIDGKGQWIQICR